MGVKCSGKRYIYAGYILLFPFLFCCPLKGELRFTAGEFFLFTEDNIGFFVFF